MNRRRIDPLTIVAGFFILFILSRLFQDTRNVAPEPGLNSSSTGKQVSVAFRGSDEVGSQPVSLNGSLDGIELDTMIPPYTDYAITQGPHGFTYGHVAVDLSAGKGASILSPINGIVTQLFVDDLGNTTLVIENDRYQVTMLHGIYTVAVGVILRSGQPVGQESNQGNTVDALGISCRDRDCGYHTHLNVYDKILLVNIYPLELWQ